MGTISDKLLYLNETKDELRDGINELVRASNEIDEDDTFRSYVEPLKSIRDRLPRVEGEGENITLDDTIEARMRKTLKGNTSQDTLTGKNLFNGETYASCNSGQGFIKKMNDQATIVSSDSNNLTFKNDYTYGGIESNYIPVTANTTYTISLSSTNLSNRFFVTQYDSSKERISTLNNPSVFTFPLSFTTTNDGYITLAFTDTSVMSNNCVLTNIQVEKSNTATTYEPYCGGTPSPNPSYPQDIHSVSGNNTLNVCGKNIWSNYIYESGKYMEDNGTINVNSAYNITRERVLPNTTYSFQFICEPSNAYTRLLAFDENNNFISLLYSGLVSANASFNRTFTTPNNTYYLYVSTRKNVTNIQLEYGNTTAYSPYTSASYNINLGSIELCKIGTYQDYFFKNGSKWYLHKEVGKVVLNGSETWSGWNSSLHRMQVAYTNLNITKPKTYDGLSNYFEYKDTANYIGFNFGSSALFIRIDDTFTTITQATTWLSNNNTIIYYVLSTPTETEITDTTLLEQLDTAWYSQDGQTNISQENNDQPFWLEVDALKDSDIFH